VQKKANFNIEALEPIKLVDKCFIPVLFVHGSEDSFIASHHSQDLHDEYAGDKNFLLVDGDLFSRRPSFCNDSISIFITNLLLVGENTRDASVAEENDSPSFNQYPSFDPSNFGNDDIHYEHPQFTQDISHQENFQPSPPLIQQIKEMGFTEEQAISALKNTNNNVERAIEYLLNN